MNEPGAQNDIWVIPNWWIPNGNIVESKFLTYRESEKWIEFGKGPWDLNFKKIKTGDIIALREGLSGIGTKPLSILMVAKVRVSDFDGRRHLIHLYSIRNVALTITANKQDLKTKFIAKLDESDFAELIRAAFKPKQPEVQPTLEAQESEG